MHILANANIPTPRARRPSFAQNDSASSLCCVGLQLRAELVIPGSKRGRARTRPLLRLLYRDISTTDEEGDPPTDRLGLTLELTALRDGGRRFRDRLSEGLHALAVELDNGVVVLGTSSARTEVSFRFGIYFDGL